MKTALSPKSYQRMTLLSRLMNLGGNVMEKNSKVDLVVLDDLIYGDDGYDLVIAKFSTARTDVEQGVVVDCEDDKFQLSTFEILMTPSLISFSHLCLKWKTLRKSSKMIWIRKQIRR
ncbi:hypothetical protein HanRHA438_Chr04g0167031 [Helianthus annuus]|nr:hypothetical protein HanRHA438_Chr04g0167031 [Helianthus annuus]